MEPNKKLILKSSFLKSLDYVIKPNNIGILLSSQIRITLFHQQYRSIALK